MSSRVVGGVVVVGLSSLLACRGDRSVQPSPASPAPTPDVTIADPAVATNGASSAPTIVPPTIVPVSIVPVADLSLIDASHRVAFVDGSEVTLADADGDLVHVGTGSAPAWTSDGRHLAWLDHDGRLRSLDTASGATLTFELPAGWVPDRIFGGDGWFAATPGEINGANRFVRVDLTTSRADVVTAIFDDGTGFDGGPGEIAIFWSDLTGDRLVAVVAEEVTNWYVHSPSLWTVTAGGSATRLFTDCEHGGCDNQLGMSDVAVSPDGQMVVYEGGERNGCDAYPLASMSAADRYAPVELHGLAENGQSFDVLSTSWPSAERVLVVGQAIDVVDLGVERCTWNEMAANQVYECTIDGACRPTGDFAVEAIANQRGDLALRTVEEPTDLAAAEPDGQPPSQVTVRWSDGRETALGNVGAVALAP